MYLTAQIKMFRTVLIISLAVYSNSCSIKTCETLLCAPVIKENCPGIIKTGGSYCGCCDACITVLGRVTLSFFILGEHLTQCDKLYW